MKRFFFYFALLGLIPLIFLTGGAESPVRYLYYTMLALLTLTLSSKALLQTSLTFSVLYSLVFFVNGDGYPVSAVIINVLSFLLMGIVSGRLSDVLQGERDSLRKTTDTFHALTNSLNLKIMNLQSKVDSVSEAYERVQESSKNKTHFISNVSHEIRAPLSSIRAFSEILLNYDDIDADTRNEFLSIIYKESGRLTQLTNEILDVVRMETGKIEWHMDAIDMGDIIRSSVKTMLPMVSGKGLSIETHIPEDLSLVRGDRNKLLQVMLNLISNAVKFTSNGKITIGIEEMSEDIKVYVSDTGEGIYPEEKEKIFEEFYRIGDDLTGRPKGSGLGLSISKKIIESHGGTIWVESQLGAGSTFFFTLRKDGVVTHKTEEPREIFTVKGKQILVLEDYRLMRQILRGAIESLGYGTIGIEGTTIALEMAKVRMPDAIIIGYPRSEEYFNELRTFSIVRGVPLFLVMVTNDEEGRPQVAVNGYISRFFDKHQIRSTIEKILPRPSGRILIASDDQEEARNLQLLVGQEGYETAIIPDVTTIAFTRPMPDAIIIGTHLKNNNIYNAISYLRNNQRTRNIPLLLTLNIFIRDVECIGLNASEYGRGLDKILESLKGKAWNGRHP